MELKACCQNSSTLMIRVRSRAMKTCGFCFLDPHLGGDVLVFVDFMLENEDWEERTSNTE